MARSIFISQIRDTGNILAGLTTANLVEGSNLYFTNARVYSNVIALLPTLAGSGIQIQANGQINSNTTLTLASLSPFLTTSNVSEGSNLYYTNARVRSALSGGTGVSYDNSTGAISIGQNVSSTADVTFTNLTVSGDLVVQGNTVTLNASTVNIEDKNLLLANGAINAAAADGAGITIDGANANITYVNATNSWNLNKDIIVTSNINAGNIIATAHQGTIWTGIYTANVIESGSALYYTNARVNSNVIAFLPSLAGSGIAIQANGQISANTQSVSLAGLTTSNLAEGSNLYYTNARARTAYTAGQNITIDSGTGVITSTAGTTVVNDSDLITVLAATTDYTLTRTVSDPKNILVINEGLIQIPTTDYTVSGTTLSTTTQYPVGSNIEVRYFGIDSTTAGAYSTTLSAVLNTFVANGSNINFPLTATPVSAAYTIVNIDGVSQLTSAYSISGSTLTFTEAPEANANINVRILGGAVGQTFNTRTYTGDGNTTNFSITSGFTENNILVFENGVAQVPTTDYTVNTTTSNVVMAVATAANVSIQIRELGSTTANVLSQILNSDLTTSSVVPKAGNLYNLGSTSAPYNKLYLSASNSLVLGNTTVSVSGNSLIISTAGASTVVGASTSSPNSRILGYNLVFGG